ncbi:MAG: hypothetical protein ABSE55_01180 [Terracidiphilus sp.]|jgi:hypothetical protein
MGTQLIQAATQVISQTIQDADHPPDPESTLRNAARATTILGKMLEDMADKSAKKVSKPARLITNFGLLGYGLVEISVPRSIWSHIASYWLQLLTLIGAAMFALGLFFRTEDTWKIGLGVLVFVWLISGLRDVLQLVMRGKPVTGWALAIQWRLLLPLACFAVLAVVYAQTVNQVLNETGGVLIWIHKDVLSGCQHLLNLVNSLLGHP